MHNREEKIEIILVLIALIVAVFLRFIQLGANSLNDAEATLALQALNLARGNTVTLGGQPGYVALTTILFFLFNAGNFWARFWPAVFGSLLVLVPLLFKPWLGKRPSLILILLLAVEPGLVALSRTASSEMIAITCVLAAIGFALRGKPIFTGIAVGLALLAGSPMWMGVLTLGIALLIFKLIVREKVLDVERIDKVSFSTILISTVATIGVLGTLFMLKPAILTGLGSGVAEFFAAFAAKGDVSIGVMALGLVLTQVLVIPLAIWGIVVGPEKHNKVSVLMIFWMILLVILVLIRPSRQVANWGWLLIPLNVLAMVGLEDFLQKIETGQWKLSLVQTTATVALVIYSYLNLIALVSNPAADSVALRNQVLAVILPLVMIFVVTMLIGWGWSFVAARQGLVAGIGLILVFVTIGNAWKSAGLGPRPEAELWRTGSIPVGADLLLSSVKDVSRYHSGEDTGIDIKLVGLKEPSLQWALHEFEDLQSEDAIGFAETSSILISKEETPLSLNNLYRGQAVKWSSKVDFSQMDGFDWVKWFSTRTVPLSNENLMLWARNDLFKGSTQD